MSENYDFWTIKFINLICKCIAGRIGWICVGNTGIGKNRKIFVWIKLDLEDYIW